MMGITVLRIICIVFATCGFVDSSYPLFQVPSVQFQSLSENADNDVLSSLSTHGLIQVEGIIGLEELRSQVLADSAKCAAAGNGKVFLMQDGTKRTTFAGNSNIIAAPKECKAFLESSSSLTKLVASVNRAITKEMDRTCDDCLFEEFDTFENLTGYLEAGTVLDHFHTYSHGCESKAEKNRILSTLDFHLDDGLFLTFLPSLFFSGLDDLEATVDKTITSQHGFLIEDGYGRIVNPQFANGGDVLVFMVQNGATGWLSKSFKSLRPVPHSVQLNLACTGNEDILRSWYGRMMLSPDIATHPGNGRNFLSLKKEKFRQIDDQNPTIPTSLRAIRLLESGDELNCTNNELLCWKMCMSPNSDACLSEPKSDWSCVNPSTHTVSKPSDMCQTCVVTCDRHGDNSTRKICVGSGSSMFMTGFSTGVNPREACVILLFGAFVLDTPIKFSMATIGTVLFGFVVELVVFFRKIHVRSVVEWTTIQRLVHICIVIVQIVFGYFAMLIAMTYSVILFIALVVGLGCGHALLNMPTLKNPTAELSDPCCSFMNDDLKPVEQFNQQT